MDGLGARPTRLVEQVVEGLEVVHAAQWMGAHHTRARALQQGAGQHRAHSMNDGLHKLRLGQISVCGSCESVTVCESDGIPGDNAMGLWHSGTRMDTAA